MLCGERIGLFAQRVEGDINERFGGAREARRLAGERIAQAQPCVGRCVGVRHPIAQPRVRALYDAHQSQLRLGARRAQARKLARDARGVVLGHRLVEMLERPLYAFRGRRIAGIQPHSTILHFHGIDAQVVAAVNGGAGLQVEFPVVPVAGQHTIAVERAFHQRIALVRTAVVACKNLALMEEQGDMLALDLHCDGARRLQPIELDRAGPFGDAGD